MRFLPVFVLLFTLFISSVFGANPSTPPQWPAAYTITGTMSLPYASLKEPFTQYFDSANNRQRIDWYAGQDIYIIRGDLPGGQEFQVNPVVTTQKCWAQYNISDPQTGKASLTPLLPSTDGFTFFGSRLQDGINTNVYQLIVNATYSGQTIQNKYTLWTNAESGVPIRYEMMGYDSLIGSHYDQYIVDYATFAPVINDPSVFNEPNLPSGPCSPFPGSNGPSSGYLSTVATLRSLSPPSPGSFGTDLSPEYSDYLSSFGKVRSLSADSLVRQHIFHSNAFYVASHNRKFGNGHATFDMRLNHLADYRESELEAMRGYRRTTDPEMLKLRPEPLEHVMADPASLPAEIDWRTKGAVAEVQDQAICGSCWSFGSTGTITGAYAIATGQLRLFSQQQLMDCSWPFGNLACDGGEDFQAYAYVLKNGGLSTMDAYGPYLGQDGFCHTATVDNSTNVVLQGYVNITGTAQLIDAIANKGPISVSINASPKSFSFYHSGVYNDPACVGGPQNLDHSVLAVGYGVDPNAGQYYIVKNSWSTYWGSSGYVLISTQNDMCGVADVPTYVVIAQH